MQKFITQALQAARRSTNKHYYHGCVIVVGGKVITSACNTSDTSCHAETLAVRKLCEKGPYT